MPILSDVGRQRSSQVALRTGIYGLLTVGAVAIVYPILIVIGQTLSDRYDLRDNTIVPYYLRDRDELALKYIFAFTPKLEYLASRHNRSAWNSQVGMRDDHNFYREQPGIIEAQGYNLAAWERVVADFNAFKTDLDPGRLMAREFRIEDYYRPFLAERYGKQTDELQAQYRRDGTVPKWMIQLYPDAKERRHVMRRRSRLGVAVMNHEFRSDYLNYYGVEIQPPGNFVVPFWVPGTRPKERMWQAFKASLPPSQTMVISADTYWHNFLKLKYRDEKGVNQAWGTNHSGIYELKLPLSPPADGPMRADWEEFVRKRWPRRLLVVPTGYAPAWRQYVRRLLLAKVGAGDGADTRALAVAGKLLGRPLGSWQDFPLPATRPADETLGRYWCEFTSSGAIPAEEMVLDAPQRRFRQFLRKTYGKGGDETAALAALNAAWQTHFGAFNEIQLPVALVDDAPVRFTPGHVRWRFVTEAYQRVAEYLGGRGRAAQNTFILVVLSLLSALTINPIAAYSLSRFPLKNTQKILIFFLATMAFPAEVAMIPNFLLLRDLGLLNTYAALVLPGMANGFAIFLLKGFFDSLPQELYEAAEMDGASELQVFRMVAMPLVTPILAFIGLNTFVLAYSSFMWAFVICPKEEMWTLMVWVYDFQTRNPGNNYIMAATVLVSIPPLLVFLVANRIIMKGIVIPSMK